MAEESTPADGRPRFDKEARRTERARIYRLSRFPFLYDFSLQGRPQAFVAGALQILVVLALVLVPAKLVTGDWLPPFIGFVVLAVAFAVQGLNRYLNAKAGRR